MTLRDPTRARKTYSFYRATPLATNSVYSLIQSSAVSVYRRGILNFSSKFTVTDNSSNLSTDVDIVPSALNITLSGAYAVGSAGPQTIQLDSTRLGISVHDSSVSGLGTSLFAVTDYSALTKYLDVSSSGLVATGTLSASGSVNVSGPVTASSYSLSTNTLAGSGSISISNSGFFRTAASGSGTNGFFSGSLPPAVQFPGSRLTIIDTLNIFGWLLTGSVAMMTGSNGSTLTSLNGTKLNMTKGSSVGLWSDSRSWLVSALSGSVSLT